MEWKVSQDPWKHLHFYIVIGESIIADAWRTDQFGEKYLSWANGKKSLFSIHCQCKLRSIMQTIILQELPMGINIPIVKYWRYNMEIGFRHQNLKGKAVPTLLCQLPAVVLFGSGMLCLAISRERLQNVFIRKSEQNNNNNNNKKFLQIFQIRKIVTCSKLF